MVDLWKDSSITGLIHLCYYLLHDIRSWAAPSGPLFACCCFVILLFKLQLANQNVGPFLGFFLARTPDKKLSSVTMIN